MSAFVKIYPSRLRGPIGPMIFDDAIMRSAETLPVKPELLDLPVVAWRGETLRVLEPPSANRGELLEAILRRRYRKPFIGESAQERTLYFSLDNIQSRMRLDDPWALDLSYTRKVMSFLLFRAAPRRILMVGLGGGSLAKYCYRYLPGARVDAVERDDDVIALRDYFLIPRGSRRLAVIAADGARYVANSRERYDVVICDAFESDGIAPSVGQEAFYENVFSSLNAGGILVANLAGPTDDRRRHLALMTRVFADDVLLVPVEGEGNEIVLAFKEGVAESSWPSIHERARALQGTLGLDFPRFASRLERSRKLGYAKRTLAALSTTLAPRQMPTTPRAPDSAS